METKPLFTGFEWTPVLLDRAYDEIEKIAIGEFGSDIYPNQIEIVSAEQMLDAYASHAMPFMYKHWSFGRIRSANELMYRKGKMGLAYEVVINSDPCISYLMENNTMTMQTLVIAHAAFGHNHFFKNNYLFKEGTDASSVIDYLRFAEHYITKCEEAHGKEKVEAVLDAAHSLSMHGVFRSKRRQETDKMRKEKERLRRQNEEETYREIWSTVPKAKQRDEEKFSEISPIHLPEENLLYFLEKHAPKLRTWEREVLRIVRNTAQYFLPQLQTKLMNEGCATYMHYRVMERLHEKGLLTEAAMLEFYHNHSQVLTQPDFAHFNPYALGFAMMRDIVRVMKEPTAEDREWFGGSVGGGDEWETLRHVWENYRDESFILQFLSPRVMREFRLFAITREEGEDVIEVTAVSDKAGYQQLRRVLADQYDLSTNLPSIQVMEVDMHGDRSVELCHRTVNGRLLDQHDAELVLQNFANLWGYPVSLREVDETDSPVNYYGEIEPEW